MTNIDLAQTMDVSEIILRRDLPLDCHPAVVYLASLDESSRRVMRTALDIIANMLAEGESALTLNWAALRFQHTALLRSELIRRYAPATVRRFLSAVRGVLKAAWKLDQIPTEAYRRAVELKSVEGESELAGRMLASEELIALFAACADDPSPAGQRDAAMLALWVVAGPRRAEIVGLNVNDYEPETGAVHILGKRHKERTVYVSNEAQQALDSWLAVRGPLPGPLFIPVHQSGKMRISRLTTQAVYKILQKRARQAGVKDVSPHDMRRTALSNLIDKTDLATAQAIAGHADPKTTTRYDRRGDRAKKAAAAKIVIPYKDVWTTERDKK